MSGRGRAPQPPLGPFNPRGVLLFRLPFDVDTATAADFNRFIERVERQLRDHILQPRNYGTRTTVLPCPQQAQRAEQQQQQAPRAGQQSRQEPQRTWFVIELESREREMRYIVPFFIEAETIYLRGYQNQYGALFEFMPNNQNQEGNNQNQAPARYLGEASTRLSFSCNYESLVPKTEQQDSGSNLDPGLTLQALPEQPQPGTSRQQKQRVVEVPRPNFGRQRLALAVRELAQGRNPPGESQHRTAQNLLLVIIRFCESVRFRSIRRAMVDLWTVQSSTGQPSRCLSTDHFGQIKNWNKLAINMQDYDLHRAIWPRLLAEETGVTTAAEAKDILVVILYRSYPMETPDRIPKWRPPRRDDDGGGPGAGLGGAPGGVLAAELPRWLPMPEEPVMEILSVDVRPQRGASRLQGIYGTVTVDDGLGAQAIYSRSRDNFQRNSSTGSQMSLELNVLDRSVTAYDCSHIDVDLWNASTASPLSTGRISWSFCDFDTNTYDKVMRATIGQAVVYSKAVQVAVSITVDNDEAAETVGWFTTMNTMIGALQPSPRRAMSHAARPAGGPRVVLHGEYTVAVPLSSPLRVMVNLQHKRSPREVTKTFWLEPTADGGTTTMTEALPQVGNVNVNFTWNLARLEPPSPASSSAGRHQQHGDLRRRR